MQQLVVLQNSGHSLLLVGQTLNQSSRLKQTSCKDVSSSHSPGWARHQRPDSAPTRARAVLQSRLAPLLTPRLSQPLLHLPLDSLVRSEDTCPIATNDQPTDQPTDRLQRYIARSSYLSLFDQIHRVGFCSFTSPGACHPRRRLGPLQKRPRQIAMIDTAGSMQQCQCQAHGNKGPTLPIRQQKTSPRKGNPYRTCLLVQLVCLPRGRG